MILKKDGKIVVNNGKILTNDGELNPSVTTKVQEALSNSLENKDAIEKIISGETPIGSIISFSVDGQEIKTDMNGNINLPLSQYIGGSKINYSSETGKLSLLDRGNNVISEVNIPLDSFVKSGQYNSVTKEIELTLTNDDVIKIPVEKLIDVYKADEKDITLNSSNTFELTDNFKFRFDNKVDKNQLSDYALKTETVTQNDLDEKQDKLASGGNIKTINGVSLLGAGNLNFADVEITDGSTITINLGSANDAKWYRLAKVENEEVKATGVFSIDYYENDSLINTTTFTANCVVNKNGEIISEVSPLIRVPNDFGANASFPDAGLVSVRIEKSDEGLFVVGLINSINPNEEKKQIVELIIYDNTNFLNLKEIESIYYAYDNEKIDYTDLIYLDDSVKCNFNFDFKYTKYLKLIEELIPGGSCEVVNGITDNGSQLIVLGAKDETTSILKVDEYYLESTDSSNPTDYPTDLIYNIDEEIWLEKYGQPGKTQILVEYNDGNIRYTVGYLGEINPEEYGINIENIESIEHWPQNDSFYISIVVSNDGYTKKVKWTICNIENDLPDYILEDKTYDIGVSENVLEKFNQNFISQLTNLNTSFKQVKGKIIINCPPYGINAQLILNGQSILSVNVGETKEIEVELNDKNIYSIFTPVATLPVYVYFKPYIDDENNILNFNFDNLFTGFKLNTSSEFMDTFPSGTFVSKTYQYGLKAQLKSYNLYDLNNKIEELENKIDTNLNDYVTRAEYNALLARIENLEKN